MGPTREKWEGDRVHVGRLAVDHLLYYRMTRHGGLLDIRAEPGSKLLHLAINLFERRPDVGILIPTEPEDI